ncbi:unnamed protein product [Dovyalis caffra]|uniref:GDSL esterase/lipase n=1 Tax=Dovyalis caffra TaxID=77055 RepID=A0AAV1QTX8_9ROSI|nr:unnamed protein product [Dovyalis caffra]
MFFYSFSPCVHGEHTPQVPCYFIFGSSAYDSGNNNELSTIAKANYPPYGVDFPQGATGRFCNGRNTADFLGFNYASAGSGIRNETGQDLGGRISMDSQLQNHQITVSRVKEIIRDKNLAAKYLSKCMYSVGIGTNDHIANYFRPQLYPTSRLYTPEQYAIVLNQQFSQQLKTLYNYGARKVILFGITPVGCAPSVRAAIGINGSSSSCVDRVNNAVQLFNAGLRSLVDDFNNNLIGAKFIFVNTYQIYSTSSSGFRVRNAPCCAVSATRGLCIPFSSPCGNRSEYLWWDAIHQSEASNMITATRSYISQSPFDTYPIDIRHLARLPVY